MSQFDRASLAQQLADGLQDLRISLDDTHVARLIAFVALLVKWNKVYNLTAVRDPQQMVTQHVLDCLAATPAFAGARNLLDVGAGGGLPGIVLAIWAAQHEPDMRISLIDTVHKKTAFLTQVKAELGLRNVTVHTARVEQLQVSEKFDVITSRAFAELSDFVTWSGHLLSDDGCFIAMKGVVPQAEIASLPQDWVVTDVQPLQIPGLQAERHLILIERRQQ